MVLRLLSVHRADIMRAVSVASRPPSSPVNAPLPWRGHFYSHKGRSVFRSIQSSVLFTKTLIRISITRTFFTPQNWHSTSEYCTPRPPRYFTSAREEPTNSKHFAFTNSTCAYNKITGACFADLPVLQRWTPERSLSVSKNIANVSLLLPNRVNILISIVRNTVTHSSWTA